MSTNERLSFEELVDIVQATRVASNYGRDFTVTPELALDEGPRSAAAVKRHRAGNCACHGTEHARNQRQFMTPKTPDGKGGEVIAINVKDSGRRGYLTTDGRVMVTNEPPRAEFADHVPYWMHEDPAGRFRSNATGKHYRVAFPTGPLTGAQKLAAQQVQEQEWRQPTLPAGPAKSQAEADALEAERTDLVRQLSSGSLNGMERAKAAMRIQKLEEFLSRWRNSLMHEQGDREQVRPYEQLARDF